MRPFEQNQVSLNAAQLEFVRQNLEGLHITATGEDALRISRAQMDVSNAIRELGRIQ